MQTNKNLLQFVKYFKKICDYSITLKKINEIIKGDKV